MLLPDCIATVLLKHRVDLLMQESELSFEGADFDDVGGVTFEEGAVLEL